MGIFSDSKSSISQIWYTTIKLYSKSFSHIWQIGIMLVIATTISTFINTAYKIGGINFKIIDFILALTMPLIIIYLTSLILFKIYNIGRGRYPSLKDALTYVNKRYLKVVIAMLIVFFLSNIFEIIALLTLRWLLIPLTIIQIFIIILLTAVQPLILCDNLEIITSLKTSIKLVWGNWWHTFAIVFPLIMINYWLIFIINFAIIKNSWYLLGIAGCLAILFCPLFYGCILVVVNDLKLRKTSSSRIVTATS
ncbi:MAG: hypothetical protein LBL17_00970 [Coxiellaceae bacterium]|jgi:hypothetical protein|nr:hypothetical protein [Coxiellaceae bacterium]